MKGGLFGWGLIIMLLLMIGLLIAGLGPGGFFAGIKAGWGVLIG